MLSALCFVRISIKYTYLELVVCPVLVVEQYD